MQKIKCFEINGIELYLDQVLAELDFPILFVCKDKCDNYYMVMCTDAYRLTYLVRKCKPKQIAGMILGQITMRQFWMDTTECWKVFTGNEMVQDKVILVNPQSLDKAELPQEKKYVIENDEVKNYAYNLNKNENYQLQISIDCHNYFATGDDDYIELDFAKKQQKMFLKRNESKFLFTEEDFSMKQENADWESFSNFNGENRAA